MTISEADRHHLHERLVNVLGEDDAAMLMEHLPPAGWTDIATRRDLDHLETVLRAEIAAAELRMDARLSQLDARISQLDARISQLDARISELDGRMSGLQAEFTKQLLLANSVMIGIVFGIARLV